MNVAKVAISIDARLLRRLDGLVTKSVFKTRSEAIQQAVEEKLSRLNKTRLARECSKLSKKDEQHFAEEGIAADLAQWPEY